MNILFLHSLAIAPDKGGIERVTATLADEFAARGNGVFYLAAKPTWAEFSDRSRQFFLPDAKHFASQENAEFFEKFLAERAIDVAVFQWADGKRFPFGEICKKRGVPVVAAIHTDPCFYEQRLRGNGLATRFKRWLRFRRQAKIYRENAACCATTVLLSERFLPGFLNHFPSGTKPEVCAISNPLTYENSAVDWAVKKNELLFVGRMETAVKQPQLLLQAWAKIRVRFPNWTLRMVGGGYDFDAVKALAKTLGTERIVFEGFQNPKTFYRNAAIFCMTSAYEGFGMVLAEAASFGCVPVAFESFAAVHDLITDGENGRLVPAFDVGQYAATLAELMENSERRKSLAAAAFRDSARFSKKEIAGRWLNLLNNLKG